MARMTDARDDQSEPGFDQTNGLVDGLDGDDDGAIDQTPESNIIGDVIADLDPDRRADDGAERDDADGDGTDGQTSYSEEGKP